MDPLTPEDEAFFLAFRVDFRVAFFEGVVSFLDRAIPFREGGPGEVLRRVLSLLNIVSPRLQVKEFFG